MSFGYLYNDEIFDLKSNRDPNARLALIDKSRLFQQGSTDNVISVCFESGNTSTSAIGKDSNSFGGMDCPAVGGDQTLFLDQHGNYSLQLKCGLSSMHLRWTDPPTSDFTWKGVTYPLSLFQHEARQGCRKGVLGFSCHSDAPNGQVVLHEFMHALGAKHEHQHPEKNFAIDETAVYLNYCGVANPDPNDICAQEAETQVLSHFTCGPRNNQPCDNVGGYDADSIMHYKLEDQFVEGVNTTKINYKLSNIDRQWLEENYPTTSSSKPRVRVVFANGKDWQKAWFEKVISEQIAPYAGINFSFETDTSYAVCGDNTRPSSMPIQQILILVLIVIGSMFGMVFLGWIFVWIRRLFKEPIVAGT